MNAEQAKEEISGRHSQAVDAFRKAQDALWATELTAEQQQMLVDIMNAAQDLNTSYWERVYVTETTTAAKCKEPEG